MESYRITRWPEWMPCVARLPVRRALAAMSVGWVSRHWLLHEAGLSRREFDGLLDGLAAQDALLRSDEPVAFGAAPPPRTGARELLGRVSRHLFEATRSRGSWFDDKGAPVPAHLATTLPLPPDTRPWAGRV